MTRQTILAVCASAESATYGQFGSRSAAQLRLTQQWYQHRHRTHAPNYTTEEDLRQQLTHTLFA